MFGSHDDWLPTQPADRAFGELMMTYWLSFARDGDPTAANLPQWPRWGASERALLFTGPEAHPGPLRERSLCGVLAS